MLAGRVVSRQPAAGFAQQTVLKRTHTAVHGASVLSAGSRVQNPIALIVAVACSEGAALLHILPGSNEAWQHTN